MKKIEPYVIKEFHISDVRAGDTVLIDGELKTVSNHHINRGFMGITLFGDSYKLGSIPVKVVFFPMFQKGQFIEYVRDTSYQH